jgi:hypothetical protein
LRIGAPVIDAQRGCGFQPQVARAGGRLNAHQSRITGRSFGIFSEPRVNVLALTLILQRAYPRPD